MLSEVGTDGDRLGETRPNATCMRTTTCFVKTDQEPRTTCFMGMEGVVLEILETLIIVEKSKLVLSTITKVRITL